PPMAARAAPAQSVVTRHVEPCGHAGLLSRRQANARDFYRRRRAGPPEHQLRRCPDFLGAESAQLRLLTLANGRLRDRPDQDLLGGGIKPSRRQRTDDRPPNTLLGAIEIGWRRRSLAREDRRYHRHRDGRLTAPRHRE